MIKLCSHTWLDEGMLPEDPHECCLLPKHRGDHECHCGVKTRKIEQVKVDLTKKPKWE